MTEPGPRDLGVRITAGPTDWQIVQRDRAGFGRIDVAGHWVSETEGIVMIRLVREDTGAAVVPHLDWHAATPNPDRTWSAALSRIPAGGLYRLETRLDDPNGSLGDRSQRGDTRHWIGVGDLWVIAGQSNAAGYGRGPIDDPPELGIHLFRGNLRWSLATHPMNDSTDDVSAITTEPMNTGHSPFLRFGRVLRRELGCPIGLVQTSRGGTWLREWERPDEPPSGALARNMFERVAAAGGSVRGLVWYQGEAEGNGLEGASYAGRLQRAIAAWRDGLGRPDLPVILVQLNRHRGQPIDPHVDQSWSLVREAQRHVGAATPGVSVVPAIDLPLSDEIHTSPAGNIVLGERLARAALGAVHGREIVYRAPDVQSAIVAVHGLAIDLAFEPVISRLATLDDRAVGFRVEDARGDVPIRAVAYPAATIVRLTLGRPIDGPAVVHAASGIDPEPVPMDEERQMPILGFHGFPVTDRRRA